MAAAPPREIPMPDTSVVHGDLAPRARRFDPRCGRQMRKWRRARPAWRSRQQGLPETSFGVSYDRFWAEPELRTLLVSR